MTIWEDLAKEFPKSAVSWRAQSVTKNGDKALALAYIDARDVMRRLDEVVGPENWQDKYEVHGEKTICYLSIRYKPEDPSLYDEWITKADGAGDTAVEAEKGSISDAFKRAAVKWGIGRYLYDMPTPWVPCESYERGGKLHWSKWKEDPWNFVRGQKPEPEPPPLKPKQKSVAERKWLWQQLMTDVKAEGAKGYKKIDAYMLNDDTKALIEDLGDYRQQFLEEVRQVRNLAKAGEEVSGQPVGQIMERVLPNFDSLQTNDVDHLEERIGPNNG